jgi:hypothetical protein
MEKNYNKYNNDSFITHTQTQVKIIEMKKRYQTSLKLLTKQIACGKQEHLPGQQEEVGH